MDAKDFATVVAAGIALLTLVKGVIEYVHQGAQKRSELFTSMRIRFKDDSKFKEICDLLEGDDSALELIPFKDKRDFLGFFEEVALLLNSGLLRPTVAHYMFGYYALRCSGSVHFWTTVNRQSPYWALFNDFVEQMKVVESSFVYRRKSMRF